MHSKDIMQIVNILSSHQYRDKQVDQFPEDHTKTINRMLELAEKMRVKEIQQQLLEFQQRVMEWVEDTFDVDIAFDLTERNNRFLEESVELVQAAGMSKKAVHNLVDYVYSRPKGKLGQEIGGVMITLLALVEAHEENIGELAVGELTRISDPDTQEKIRIKQTCKPRFEYSDVYEEREDYEQS